LDDFDARQDGLEWRARVQPLEYLAKKLVFHPCRETHTHKHTHMQTHTHTHTHTFQ
jgi:hypothetical protein